jgi:hypothetical protein
MIEPLQGSFFLQQMELPTRVDGIITVSRVTRLLTLGLFMPEVGEQV